MNRIPRRQSGLWLLLACSPALAGDWNNSGGNAARNGQTDEIGPDAATLLWSGGRSSIIAWQPVIEGRRVFMVRELTFPPSGVPNDAFIVCQDLDTGAELWAKTLPYNSGEWIPWIAGVKDGRVFCSRSGNGGSVEARMHALDAADGHTLWVSQDPTRAGAYDGCVFAPDGDLIVASHVALTRINAEDGATVWTVVRDRAVSGNCGPVLWGDRLYVDGLAVGGQVIERRSLATGAYMYESPVMSGFTEQNTPMVGPDGTVYFSRTQNNAAVDFFYAFTDTGSALTLKWSRAAQWTTTSEFTVGPDGSVYMMIPGLRIARLDPATGVILNQSDPIVSDGSGCTPRMAADALGRIFFSNGQFANGRVYSFNPDLTQRWFINVTNVNIGAPAIGAGGTLVVAGVGTNVRAYRTPCNPCDVDCNGTVNNGDVAAFVAVLVSGASPCSPCGADVNGDGGEDGADIPGFVACVTGG